MKICPLCAKTYDDSWNACLQCTVALEDFKGDGHLKQIKQLIEEKEKSGIKQCSDCKNEFNQSQLRKTDVMRIGGLQTVWLCPGCCKKVNKQINIVGPIIIISILILIYFCFIAPK